MVLFRIKPLLALIAAWTFVPVIRGGGYHDHCDTIAEIACAGYYDMLCKAIKETQLYHRLDDKHEHFTAFFPYGRGHRGIIGLHACGRCP